MAEAVVFVLDASPSMNTPYPRADSSNNKINSNNTATTRLSCCKQAITSMIGDLMLQSKKNRACVIVSKTRDTHHHMMTSNEDGTTDMDEVASAAANADGPYPHLTELWPMGLKYPSVELLQEVNQVVAMEQEDANNLAAGQGDLWSAILVAADALDADTKTLRAIDRKIVIFTDAEQDILVDPQESVNVIQTLCALNVRVQVVGLDFGVSAVYDAPFAAAATKIKQEDMDDNDDESGNETDNDNDEDDDDDEEMDVHSNHLLTSKETKERLLLALTEQTGGVVAAASTLQQVLAANKGLRIKKSTKRKFTLCIGPGLDVEARFLLMMSRDGYPTLKKEAVLVNDKDGTPMTDELGEYMTDDVSTITQYAVKGEQPIIDMVLPKDQTTAFRFGSDYIAVDAIALEGIKPKTLSSSSSVTGCRMEILGYMEQDRIPKSYHSGTPYVVSGNESLHACALIATLAQALQRLEKVAICTFFKTNNSPEPLLGALYPNPEPEYENPIHLVFLELPYSGDVKMLDMESLEQYIVEEKLPCCDDLIDSLMLPDDVLAVGKVPNPFLRSWNTTKIERALNPKAERVTVRPTKEDSTAYDPMKTPHEILTRAKPALDCFAKQFPLVKSKAKEKLEKKKGKKGKKQGLYFGDYLS